MSTAATRSPSARRAFRARPSAASEGRAWRTIVPPALKFIRPGISQRSPLGSTVPSEASLSAIETGDRPRVRKASLCAAQRRNAGVFKYFVGEIFVRRQRRRGGVVLRIPWRAPGAEVNAVGLRSYAEEKSGSAVEVLKGEAEFGAGICRINRLVRIEARFSRSKFPQVPHAISDGLTFHS